jgi:hypothetical protein
MQDFAGPENIFAPISVNIINNMNDNYVFAARAMNLVNVFRGKENCIQTLQMDKDFCIGLNITV